MLVAILLVLRASIPRTQPELSRYGVGILVVPKKLCPGCNTEKPANIKYFIRSPKYEDNLKPLCIVCSREVDLAKNRIAQRLRRKSNKDADHRSVNLRKLFDPKRHFLNMVRGRARSQKIPFNLTYETMPEIPEVCPVFGFPLKLDVTQSKLQPDSATIDRIEPSKGYTQGNVEFISWRANFLKRDGTLEEFEKLVAHMRKSM